MTSTDTTTETHHCLGCGRKITSPESIAAQRGKGCRAKIRRAARTADLSAWKPEQIEDAREAIEDGAVVPTSRPEVFQVVSIDGTEVHRVHRDGCNCISGLKTRQPRPCWHRCAVAIVLASQARTRPAAAPAPAPVPLPSSTDMWAEIERLNDVFMAFA